MSTESIQFEYEVEAIDSVVRRTNHLLRAMNAIRNTVRDIQQVWEEPTISNVLWTLIQITRTYTSLRRVMKDVTNEVNLMTKTPRMGGITGGGDIPPVSYASAFRNFAITMEANINGQPVPITAIDISDIKKRTATEIQRILEGDAPQMVEDARRVLEERIRLYESATGRPSKSTGYLSTTVGWESTFPGVRLFAHAPYAFWVEEGQRSFTGHHFLYNAAGIEKRRLITTLNEELNQLIFRDVRI